MIRSMIYKLLTVLCMLGILGFIFKDTLRGVATAWYLEVPLPKYSVLVERGVPVSLSDGTVLYGDVYRPDSPSKFSCILARTPYSSQNPDHYYAEIATFFAGQGFVFVVQNVRGKIPSEGEFYPHKYEAKDGAETVKWITKQTWSDGQITLYGFSYLGVAGWQASDGNPAIKSLSAWFSSRNPYKMWYDKQVALLKPFIFWMATYAGHSEKAITHLEVDKALDESSDWSTLDVRLTGQTIPAYQDFLAHPKDDDFWQVFNPHKHPDVPALLGSGWYDQFLTATIDDYNELMTHPEGSLARESRLILGPWSHTPTTDFKQLNLPSSAKFINQFSTILKWVRYWMPNGQEKQSIKLDIPAVSYFVMIENSWKTASTWPPQKSKRQTLYLTGDKKLSITPPLSDESLAITPLKRIPTYGGRMLYSNNQDGPLDQAYLLQHADVIIWSYDIQEPTTVVGAPVVKLFLADAPRLFDLSAKLIDKFPSGKMQLITDGYVRLKRESLAEGEAITLKLADTAYKLEKGHSLQLVLTHSDFPHHEPSENKELIRFELGASHPSSLQILQLEE